MRQIHKTDIEKIMKINLEKLNLDFVEQYPIRGSYILDFANPKLRIAVECDGSFWHPEGNYRDIKKNYFLKRRGWIVLRFSDKEIKEEIELCLEKIQETVERRLVEIRYGKDKDKDCGNSTTFNESICV